MPSSQFSGTGLNWGQGKFGPRRLVYFCWHVHGFGHNLASASISGLWHGLSRRGTVSGDFFPLAMAWVQPKRPVHVWREAPCVNVITVWEYKRIGRWLLEQDKLETHWSDRLHEESKSCFILFWLDKYLRVHYEVTPTDMSLGDSRSLFSSFSSFPHCSPLFPPYSNPPPPSAEFLISKCAVWQG